MTQEKQWYQSKTIWGALIAVASSLTGAFGISLDSAAQGDMADALVQLVGALGALLAIFGRLSATRMIL
ncbi:MAG: hypothetical protein AAFN43_01885 [Pseudomonadota bacterium]